MSKYCTGCIAVYLQLSLYCCVVFFLELVVFHAISVVNDRGIPRTMADRSKESRGKA